MAAIVGALRAVLSLDSAAFVNGLVNARRGLDNFEKRTAAIGAQMQKVGAVLSAALTAPLAGVAAGVKIATANLSALDNQARIAGLSAQQFKVLSLAAGEFGVGQEQLSGILKDVNDKVGDFLATGGGPMKDFFDNIAPQVGVTAEQFRNLNSADALQLYITSLERAGVSQADMTFYLEGLASDLTALLPLFQDNGAAIAAMEAEANRLGLKIDGDLIAAAKAANREFEITKEILGLQLQQALVRLAPAVARLVEILVPAIEQLSRWVGAAGEAFSNLSPAGQSTAIALAAVAAALGPVLVGLGVLVAGLGPAVKLVVAVGAAIVATFGAPVALAALAIAGLAAGVWYFWDQLKAAVAWVGRFATELPSRAVAAVNAFSAKISEVALSVKAMVTDAVAAVADLGSRLVAGIAEAASAVLTAALTIGDNIVQGIRQGIEAQWTAFSQWFRDKISWIPGLAEDELQIRSPSRVFREIGGFVTEGLALGINDGLPKVEGAMRGVTDSIQNNTDGLTEFGQVAKDVFRAVAFEGQSLGSALRKIGASWFSSKASSLFDTAFNTIASAMGFANGGVFSGGRVTAFAQGGIVASPTMFPMQGGAGLMGEAGPEAIMPLTRGPGGRLGVQAVGGSATDIRIGWDSSIGNFRATVRDEAGRVVASATPGIISQAVSETYRTADEVPLL